jgi:hypothetical protein
MSCLLGKRWSHSAIRNMLAGVVFASAVSTSVAEVFFEQDFESGSIDSSPSPKWAWTEAAEPGNVESSMMYGETDVYYVTNDVVNTGSYSLRMNFAGRNQWCDACGSKTVTITQDEVNASCISVSGSPWQGTVYNKTNGFSRWDIESSSDDEVCFDNSGAIGDSVFGSASNEISAGDEIKIPYMCGVNGVVGNDISRHSDCDKAINYLENVVEADLGYGETLSRRFHMYIPSETVLPATTLKLGYSHWQVEGGPVRSVKLKLSVQRNLRLELNMPNSEGANPDYYMEQVVLL